ncbi:MAG: hypothetical protein ACI92I_000846, partial [Acidimicrobiales bacterium]
MLEHTAISNKKLKFFSKFVFDVVFAVFTEVVHRKNKQSRTYRLVTLLILCSFILPSFLYSPNIVSAAINEQINYQGKLLDNLGSPVTDGTYNVE